MYQERHDYGHIVRLIPIEEAYSLRNWVVCRKWNSSDVSDSYNNLKEKGFLIQTIDGLTPDIPRIILDKYGYAMLEDGNHRVTAAKELGIKQIPITVTRTLAFDSRRDNSRLRIYKHISEKYKEISSDKEIKNIISSYISTSTYTPVKLCSEETIKKHLYYDYDYSMEMLSEDIYDDLNLTFLKREEQNQTQ